MSLFDPSDIDPVAAPLMTSGRNAGWWKGAVIYRVFPLSFRDSDGDGFGDLKGVIGGLDHIVSLGADAIWLAPVYRSPLVDSGFDVSDPCDVDPVFGDLEMLDRLVARAHRLGLKVILDQVCSNTSNQHSWFAQSRHSRDNPKADWYVWGDPKPDGSPPNNWQSLSGGPAWCWDARRGQYYLHSVLPQQPGLNLHNDAVQAALLEIVRFWLERGIDGVHLHALDFAMPDPLLRDNPPSGLAPHRARMPADLQAPVHSRAQPEILAFLERLRVVLDQWPDRFAMAERVGPGGPGALAGLTEGDGRLHGACSDDFLAAGSLSADLVRKALSAWAEARAAGWPVWAFASHAVARVASRWGEGQDRTRVSRVAMMVLLSLRGSPVIYQGEELGLPDGRDGARTPFPWLCDAPHAGFTTGTPWLAPDAAHRTRALDRQARDPGSMLAFTRRLVALRRSHGALRSGPLTLLESPGDVLAFTRAGDGGPALTCVYNLGGRSVDWSAAGLAGHRVVVCDTGSGAEGLPATLPPWSGYWLVPGGAA